MTEQLFKKYLEEEIEDAVVFIAYNGINGLLEDFESWLLNNRYTYLDEKLEYVCQNIVTSYQCERCGKLHIEGARCPDCGFKKITITY
jgi:hypothetical protein